MYFRQVCVPGECEGAIIGLQTEVVSRRKAEEVGEYGAQVSRYQRAAGVEKKMQPGGNYRFPHSLGSFPNVLRRNP